MSPRSPPLTGEHRRHSRDRKRLLYPRFCIPCCTDTARTAGIGIQGGRGRRASQLHGIHVAHPKSVTVQD
ncbi:hypothetical protein NDU88_002511 [Pleurodeles waltl]|uniref:Uncharacterized protein n=1 Tax=Pleurodeles waltl TaxID=8319 RepID=A0AAV7TKR1_PLEWA|nr:hypothetical protein NDU88_002511 [Pleurodeles waltl]